MRRFDPRRMHARVFCALPGTFPLSGQSTAEVHGRVTDASHKPVVSAFVIMTAQDTSLMRAATTDDAGEFEFASLPIGTYQPQVKAADFPTLETSGVRASIGQVVSLDVVLSQLRSLRSAVREIRD